jgi:hypothetical protein
MTYTETGHAFGLPHSDEDFYNKDLGNCMDYTANPAANQQPDGTNYAFLQDLYGTVDEATVEPSTRHLTTTTTTTTTTAQPATKIPHDIRVKIMELLPVMENHPMDHQVPPQGWRVLHRSLQGQAHEIDLGNEWTLQVHKLAT